WPTASETLEGELRAAINAQRALGATCGSTTHPAQSALTLEATLTDLARCWAKDMAEGGWFGYSDPNDVSLFDAVAEAYGQPPTGTGIAYGQAVAEDVLTQFMADPTLCGNVMHHTATTIGVGHSLPGDYWVVLIAH
ncbi:MAG: hypothetical protein DRI90_18315, partial [Deltaproteobacteria bacterium]